MRPIRFVSSLLSATIAISSVPAIAGSNVEIISDTPGVTLFRIEGEATIVTSGGATGRGVFFRPVCVAPCRKELERDSQYFVGGDGIAGSGRFMLPDGDTQLRVNAGSALGRWAGYTLAVLGGGAALGSVFFVGATKPVYGADGTSSTEPDPDRRKLGYMLLGGGLVALVGGIVLLVTNSTTVKTSDGATLAKVKTPVATFQLQPTGTIAF